MRYIPRTATDSILESQKHYPVIVITGPRQSGKSTLARHIFPDYAYYSMEDIDIREMAASDPRSFLNQGLKGMIIDEAQRLPLLMSYIQGIVDNNPQARFVITGSAQFSLLKSVSQSLAGRAAMFELLPLSWLEIDGANHASAIDEELFRGFYPAVRDRDIPPTEYYRNYTKTYLEKDVRDLLNVSNLDTFGRFMRLCAARIGSQFVAKDISDDLGVSVNTVKSWLGVLQASYIVFMLPPFYENIGKRLVKTPKIYFTDTGLASYLLGIESSSQLNIDRMRGHLFENFIVIEALKKRYNRGRDANEYYLRDSNGNEIDLMIKAEGNGYDCFEIKSSATFHKDFEKSLLRFERDNQSLAASTNVIYTGETTLTARTPRLLNLTNFLTYI